jgi:hypothetical protein
MREHLKLFIDDIKNDKFHEAHEDLENYWRTIRKTDHPLKNLCKGFINGATAFELIRRGKDDGARTLWKTHQKYLPLMQEGIENYDLFYKANEILQELKKKHHGILSENLQGTNMSVKLDTRTFFFNAKTDFLAYYKNHTIKIDDSKKVKDVLIEIQALEPIFQFKKTNTMLQINGVSIKAALSIKKAVELFGTSWTIDPISTFRATNDLIINEDDFIAKHEILAAFAEEEDFKYYKTLIGDYYASIGLKHTQDYFGDSTFIYAHHLIAKYPEKKEAILKAIDSADGIWLYEKECNQYPLNDNATKINALKAEFPAQIVRKYTPDTMAYYDKAEEVLCAHFGVKKDEDCALETIIDNITIDKIKAELKHSFEDFQVAFYAGSFECENLAEVQSEAEKLLAAIGAKVVKFGSSDSADGFDLVSENSKIAYNKAGNIALDAYDSGAEILVVDSKESHFMMDQSVKKCECEVGRDITIPILNISQIVALAIGITNVEKIGLSEHKIKQELI